MEAQTLQQQTPIYHVCQQCNGAGCQACSDLLILDGDIQLDPDWNDELPEPSPINGVIGVKPLFAYRPTCPFCGEFLAGDGHSQVMHCPDTQADYDSFEPDASPVYCYQVEA